MDETPTPVCVNDNQKLNGETENKTPHMEPISTSKSDEKINNQNINSSKSVNSDIPQNDSHKKADNQAITNENHNEINIYNKQNKLSKDTPSRQSLTQLT
ncbi:hypothetical protein TVAG_007130 [Trichomonas vaginalis G3]|uniref:Uncharacterized protein n=1 Tax=Trichomonas vaginalis (strain ATCC PRA-98 / G3) TaxID=412133 RepID=A2F4H4_TRIV3|nr:hypothetical protein TVAGG3_0421970 [Trichomonas vaginalis G3]EAY00183.1 hypothetical protein TVAG_007130 [Trichomonas vaginalis G3]KAI5536135.1 hypothetical protein TVAGG3_0421970 [Trichomonas vaginalis G3]|eukprot:XP_001313112.1 hypothetical protein [Trichomonas vaginalis G3]